MRIRAKPKLRLIKTKFTHFQWHWTNATENLFKLSREELFVYNLLITEASK